jgi:hypothetical protein
VNLESQKPEINQKLVVGQVLEARQLRRIGSATHAVIFMIWATECMLRSVRIKDGKPEFFRGAQTRRIPKESIPKRYKFTDMVMKIN